MKKIFIAFFIFVFSNNLLNAQNLILNTSLNQYTEFTEYYQKYFKQLADLVNDNIQHKNLVRYYVRMINKQYDTVEQNQINSYPSDYEGISFVAPNPEITTTDSYIEVTFSIPEGYTINKYIKFDDENRAYLFFITESSILLSANNKDISFKLDYDIDVKNNEDMLNIEDGYLYKPLDITIRYSPKYFTLERVFDNYQYVKTVEFNYHGRTIALDTEIYPVLRITTPESENISYVLKPKFANIYNDFKFVREGHKSIQCLQR